MFKITKTFAFEAAHYLKNTANEGCKNVHGHSYKFKLVLCKPELDLYSMVVDFTVVGRIVKSVVLDNLDHRMLVPAEAKQVPSQFIVVMPPQPTAEVIAKWIYDRLKEYLPLLESVEVWETETSSAIYVGEEDSV